MTDNNLFNLLIILTVSLSLSCTNVEFSEKSRPSQKQIKNDYQLMFIDNKNCFWFVSASEGLLQLKDRELKKVNFPQLRNGEKIISIQNNGNSILFFDTTQGVYRYVDGKFKELKVNEDKSLSNEDKWSLSGKIDLWFIGGWHHNGPFRFVDGILYHLDFPESPKMIEEIETTYNPLGVYTIYVDNNEFVWFGTANNGLYVYNGKTISWHYKKYWTTTPTGGAFGIRSIIQDMDGFYWVCTPQHKYNVSLIENENSIVNEIIFEEKTAFVKETNLYFQEMKIDSTNVIWGRTFNNGVWRIQGQDLKQFYIETEGEKITPNSFYQDSGGKLWFNTKNGIFIYDYDEGIFEKVDFLNL